MASTLEQCESKSIGPLSSTLEMFDTFKTSQDKDTDSDEESFHLPLLGCDDDIENDKEATSETGTPTAETEDEILNKFESTGTPDLDPKLEENILNDEDDHDAKEKNNDQEDIEINSNLDNSHERGFTDDSEMFHDLEVVDETDEDNCDELKNRGFISGEKMSQKEPCESNGTQNQFDEENSENAVETNETDQAQRLDSSENVMGDETVQCDEEVKSDKEFQDNEVLQTGEKEHANNVEYVEKFSNDVNDDISSAEQNNRAKLTSNKELEVMETDDNNQKNDTKSIQENHDNKKVYNSDHEEDNMVQKQTLQTEEGAVDLEKNINEESDSVNKLSNTVDEVPSVIQSDQNIRNAFIQIEDDEVMDIENSDESSKELSLDNTNNLNNQINKNGPQSEENNEVNKTTHENIEEDSKLNDENKKEDTCEVISEEVAIVKKIESAMDIDESEDGEKNIKNKLENTSTENSNRKTADKDKDIEKHQTETNEKDPSLECEDLLDISVIRDADEDNASAIEENDNHSSEKSDNDEQEDDKHENDAEDTEAEPEDTLLSNEIDEPMEFDENTNSCDQETSTADNLISENTSDGENKENEPIQSESESQNPLIDNIADISSNESLSQSENKLQEPIGETDTPKQDSDKSQKIPNESEPPEEVPTVTDEKANEKLKESNTPVSKRPLSETDAEEVQIATKKLKLSQEDSEEKKKSSPSKTDRIKTLLNFEQFMKKRSLGEGKLTRSDLEQFCLQKICEAMIHKTEVGELHQTIKKLEMVIDNLRKDIQQLGKQTRDLDIVNKKLMNELRAQNGSQKPLVPLKITRSVGLQVKLNFGVEPVGRRKSMPNNTPKTPNTPVNNAAANRARNVSAANNVVRQVVPATPPAAPTRKTPTPAPILTQALQTRTTPSATGTQTPTSTAAAAATNKRVMSTIRPKNAEPVKPSAPGVIDLTDEDDRIAKTIQQKNVGNKSMNAAVKILNKNISVVQNKSPGTKANNAQSKTVPVKTAGVGNKVGMQARAVATLPHGVRLTTTQMKNGITIPASVVTSNAQGTTQLMYVVQPGSLVNSTAGGNQKAVLLNFQPTNGVLTSTINGSTVSVIPSKNTNTMQLKTISPPRKHPAPLPLPPPAIINTSQKKLLPKPHLSIRKTETGIILQWRMPYNLDDYEGIASYQLFAYQETNAPPSTDMWRKVGDVKALALPMACTLTQFADKNKYYFAVRSVDVHKRIGAFSDPEEISL